jgi:hypothetical protein
MQFTVEYSHPGRYPRRSSVDAPCGAAAEAIAARNAEPGERVTLCILASRVTVDPCPVMPSDHARVVAQGGRKS